MPCTTFGTAGTNRADRKGVSYDDDEKQYE